MKTRRASWRSRLAFWRKQYDWPAYLEAMRRITKHQAPDPKELRPMTISSPSYKLDTSDPSVDPSNTKPYAIWQTDQLRVVFGYDNEDGRGFYAIEGPHVDALGHISWLGLTDADENGAGYRSARWALGLLLDSLHRHFLERTR